MASTIFLLAQLAVMAVWTVSYQRRQKENGFGSSTMCLKSPQSTMFERDIAALR